MSNVEALFCLKAPYFHLLVGKPSDLCNVESKVHLKPNVFIEIIQGDKCDTASHLFKEFAKAFSFPSYFGENWAAFDECINDLEWVNKEGYILLITKVDKLLAKDEDFKIFINTLHRAIQEWVEGRSYDSFPTTPTPFHVVFQSDHKNINDRFERVGIGSSEMDILTYCIE